jgi:hypothetical protein
MEKPANGIQNWFLSCNNQMMGYLWSRFSPVSALNILMSLPEEAIFRLLSSIVF